MHEPVRDFVETATAHDFSGVSVECAEEIDGDHGRIETRRYGLTAVPQYFDETERWKGLKGIGYVIRQREIGDKTTPETTYYLLSYANDVQRFAQSVRGHWSIENALHWSLDVRFHEDQSRIRTGFAGENLAVIRHLALNLLKQENTANCGITAKRKCAGWDNRYLFKLLGLARPAR